MLLAQFVQTRLQFPVFFFKRVYLSRQFLDGLLALSLFTRAPILQVTDFPSELLGGQHVLQFKFFGLIFGVAHHAQNAKGSNEEH